MTEKRFKDYEIFGNWRDRHGECCDCCNGFCTWEHDGQPETPDALFTVAFPDGPEYITDWYVMLAADLVHTNRQLAPLPYHAVEKIAEWEVPETEPGPSTASLGAEYMRLLTQAGIDIREGDGPRQLLYLDGRHVGWLMGMNPDAVFAKHAVTLADLPEILEVAKALPVVATDYASVVAAQLITWERRRRAASGNGRQEA